MNEEHDINLPHDADDLSRHAPALFRLKGKQEGFVVPEKYFEELPSLIEAKTVIPRESGLTGPQNYFEELPSLIEAKVNIPSEGGLTEPGNYFNELSSNIESKIALESILPKGEGDIPADYFDQMESELHVHIALDNVKQEEGFVVPDNYFENLTQRILAETAVDNFDTELSVSPSVEDPNVPAGYFEELPGKVLARIESEENQNADRGRVVVFAAWIRQYARPAAIAASAALVIGLSWFFLSGRENNSGGSLIAKVNGIVPDRVIRVVPPVQTDIHRDSVPEKIAVQIPNKPKGIKLQQNPEVIMNEDEIIAQSDLMDESMVMDFVAESEWVETTETMDASMMEYLINDNVFDPGDIR